MSASTEVAGRLVRVAVAVPLADAFDYLWAAEGDAPPAGSRVRVPFGRRERIGLVVEHPSATTLSAQKLRSIREVLDRKPLIGSELMQTLRWAADYYHHPIGEVLNHALPGTLREGRALEDPPERAWRLTDSGREQPRERVARSARQQARVLAELAEHVARTESDLKRFGVSAATLTRLAAKNWIEPAPPEAAPPQPTSASETPPELTADQREVIAAIVRDKGAAYRAYLLHGVTGSGKTEVYLRLIARELARGRQTLLLVPEIGLTPQLVARLRARFGDELAVLHSGLTERERFVAWRGASEGRAKLVVGTRSAVFAPLPAGGLIIVDEEHDPSYKQQRGFRYSARDLAVVRARRLGIPVVLASATPSLESFHNASTGRYRKLDMPRRVGLGGQPQVRVLDLGRLATRQALSTPLVSAIERHLAAGSQVMLFLNRRGFAPALFCPQCKSVEECGRCDARMTVHAKAAVLRCHHCGQERPLRWACAACGNERLAVGAGTQRVGDELATLFPGVRVARLDRDATSRKGTLAAVLAEVESGATQILVGTQMLTKGHDFPRVTLVGVLNADQGLFGTDPRSHERLAQTIVQVAGRAGRGDLPGEVLIQTHYPQHPLLERLLTADYASFAALALEERRATEWPPFSHLAAWRAESIERAPAFAFLNRVKDSARESDGGPGVKVLGPAPQQMERREGRYRAQLLFQSAQRGPLHELLGKTLHAVRGSPEARKVRWSVDVDPLEL
jgi:primosomal protein N' (replication factor Y)